MNDKFAAISSPIFNKDGGFLKELKSRASILLSENHDNKYADRWAFTKFAIFLTFSMALYLASLHSANIWIFTFVFILFVFISMLLAINSFHDASHNSVFVSSTYNRWLMVFVSIPLGVNPDIWTLRHVYFHHSYPNIDKYDLDIEPNMLLRQSPFHQWFPHFRYQHFYWPLVAAISLPYLCWYSDWLDQLGKTPLSRFSRLFTVKAWVKFLALKLMHLIVMVIIPLILLDSYWWQILLVYITSQMIASCFLVIVILGTHWAEVGFFQAEDRFIKHSWSHHAFLTACDWQPKSRFVSYILGGLDLHLTHHLLPGYSHRHYPQLSKIVEELAGKYQLPYRKITYRELFLLQQKFLREMGRRPINNY